MECPPRRNAFSCSTCMNHLKWATWWNQRAAQLDAGAGEVGNGYMLISEPKVSMMQDERVLRGCSNNAVLYLNVC